MTPRHAAVCLFAGLHLFVVVCGALRVAWLESPAGVVGELAKTYAALSGADSSYGFFAPAVPPRRRVRLQLLTNDGKRRDVALVRDDAPPESRSSLKALLSFFVRTPAARHGLAESWASRMLDRQRNVVEVTVAVEEMETPSMARYREGARPFWRRLYAETFSRNHR